LPSFVKKESFNMDVSQLAEEKKYAKHSKEYYEYKLKGVVVHSGTAEYGHYFSYVNHKENKLLFTLL
jgi:ubiquitin C-terminal hydrolase